MPQGGPSRLASPHTRLHPGPGPAQVVRGHEIRECPRGGKVALQVPTHDCTPGLALRRLRGGARGESAAEPSGPSEEDKELVGGLREGGDPLTEEAREGGSTQRKTSSCWWVVSEGGSPHRWRERGDYSEEDKELVGLGWVIWAGGPLGLWELVVCDPITLPLLAPSPRNRRPCLSSMASAPGATALLRGRLLLLISQGE